VELEVGTALSADWMRPSRWNQRNRVSQGKSIGSGMDGWFLGMKNWFGEETKRFFAERCFRGIV